MCQTVWLNLAIQDALPQPVGAEMDEASGGNSSSVFSPEPSTPSLSGRSVVKPPQPPLPDVLGSGLLREVETIRRRGSSRVALSYKTKCYYICAL